MAKKHFGKFVAFAAIAGTAAAGISYFLRYKSFHKELDEDFHDFEDDFDEDLKDFGDTQEAGKPLTRNYVPLGTDRQASAQSSGDSAADKETSKAEETNSDGAKTEEAAGDGTPADVPADRNEDSVPAKELPTDESATAQDIAAQREPKAAAETASATEGPVDTPSDSAQAAEPGSQKDPSYKSEQPEPATTIIEDTTE